MPIDDCPICYEELSFFVRAILPCRHVFHTKCIRKWFQKSKFCPMCKGHVSLLINIPEDIKTILNALRIVPYSLNDGTEYRKIDKANIYVFFIMNGRNVDGVKMTNTLSVSSGQKINFYELGDYDYISNITFLGEECNPFAQTSWLKCCSVYMPFILEMPKDGVISFDTYFFINDVWKEIAGNGRVLYDGNIEYTGGTFSSEIAYPQSYEYVQSRHAG